MFGQGSPLRCRIAANASVWKQLAWAALLLVATPVASFSQQPVPQPPTDARIRIAWGGGLGKIWKGRVSIEGGSISQPKLLGQEADEAGSIYVDRGELQIESRSRRSYDGVDLTFRGPPAALVSIDLRDEGGLDTGVKLQVPLSKLLYDVEAARLDDTGNRLVARRAPGDKLRVEFPRDHLVFDPGEEFTFQVVPHLLGLPANASYNVLLRLTPARRTDEKWTEQVGLTTDATGNLPALEKITLPLPAEEGVYDLVVSVHPWQFTSAIRRPKPVVERKVQLVVVSRQPVPPGNTAWQGPAFEIDPANPTWWDRLPSLKTLWPSFSQGPISHGDATIRNHLTRGWVELSPGAWQAYPLGVGDPGKPHLVEVEYPSDVPQRLGISIVEPNAGGRIAPQGIDSGVIVTEENEFVEGKVVRHRLVVWPKSESPLILLTNRSEDQAALFGRIRVLNGPDHLPPLAIPANEELDKSGRRMLHAYFDKPLFTDNFSATDALDSGTGRSLDDWVTFYHGGVRLVEYLKHMGYSGAILSASCEGSSIYPSKVLAPTPLYDKGTFFVTGQDPIRKDVLELLMRLFARENLTLIPAMQFATPIPRLEEMRRGSNPTRSGLEWIDPTGKSWLDSRGTFGGLAPYYNPLHPAVRKTINDAVAEVAGRYRHHDSYGGIALQIGPQSYARLPGDLWGFDDASFDAFQATLRQNVETDSNNRFGQRARFALGQRRDQWIRWRAEVMSTLYEELAQTAAANRPDASLYLADAHLQADAGFQQMIHPGLPRSVHVQTAFLTQGIDLERLRKHPRLRIMRSRRDTPETQVVRKAATIEMNQADDIARSYKQLDVRQALRHSEPDILRLNSFDDKSPWGPENTFTRLVSQMSRSEAGRRQALIAAIAEQDRDALADGGWMLPLGQEDALRGLFLTWRNLPLAEFETVAPDPMEGPADGSLVVRRLTQRGKTWLYVVNNAPWPVAANLDLSTASTTPVQSLGTRPSPQLTPKGESSTWKVDLQGYDLVAIELSAEGIEVTGREIEIDAKAIAAVKEVLAETNVRIKAIPNVAPLRVLANPGFEAPPIVNQPIPAWTFAAPAVGRTGIVTLDGRNPRNGGNCLRMEHNGAIAWMRSDPLPVPTTGRIAILVWLRVEEGKPQPRVHLSLDYDHEGQHRYESKVAGGGGGAPLRAGWTPYVANFDKLPTENVSDLRVGIDVMTPGAVWVDDVEVHDARFEAAELTQLTKIWANGNFAHGQGRIGDAYHVMQGFWPRFLRDTIEPPADDVAALPEIPAASPKTPPAEQPPAEEESPGILDRVKQMSPTRWLPFR